MMKMYFNIKKGILWLQTDGHFCIPFSLQIHLAASPTSSSQSESTLEHIIHSVFELVWCKRKDEWIIFLFSRFLSLFSGVRRNGMLNLWIAMKYSYIVLFTSRQLQILIWRIRDEWEPQPRLRVESISFGWMKERSRSIFACHLWEFVPE